MTHLSMAYGCVTYDTTTDHAVHSVRGDPGCSVRPRRDSADSWISGDGVGKVQVMGSRR